MDNTEGRDGVYESRKEAVKGNPSDEVKLWLEALDIAGELQEKWEKSAELADKVFAGEEGETGTTFNIYHANLQTLIPALYNSTPIPDVRRRYQDEDPIGKDVAELLERALSYSIDQYDFDSAIEDTVADMAGPGRGLARIKYSASTGLVGGIEDVVDQQCTTEHVNWRDFRHGPSKKWKDVPWIAYRKHFTRSQFKALIEASDSKVNPKKIPLDGQISRGDVGEQKATKPPAGVIKTGMCWEIWDKETRKVIFIAPSYKDSPVAVIDDPLGVEEFFDTPCPMVAIKRTNTLVPICEYSIYKSLLTELDDITKRIRRLVKQVRPRALFAGKVPDIQTLAEADDGELVEVTSQWLEGGGLEKLLAWFPLDPTVKALAQLYVQRDNVKAQIYEVTGMADIMRGISDPNETAKAQEIKNKWGTLRVQKRQQEVQRYIRDLFRLKAEIIAKKFDPMLLGSMLGMQIAPEVAMALQNDAVRPYIIDIETDSTIKGNLAHNQEAMSLFVQASGGYFQAMAPAVQAGAMTIEAAATIYASFCRQFNLGKQAEDTLDSLVSMAQQQQQMQQQAVAANGGQPLPTPEEKAAEQQMAMQQQDQEATRAADLQKHQISEESKIRQVEAKSMAEAQKAQAEVRLAEIQLQEKLAMQEFEKHQFDSKMALDRDKMKSDAAQKGKDRANQIVLSKMSAKAAKKGKGMEGEEEDLDPFEQTLKALATLSQGVAQLAQFVMQQEKQLQQLQAAVLADAEIVRDESGRPVGARKVMNKGMLN